MIAGVYQPDGASTRRESALPGLALPTDGLKIVQAGRIGLAARASVGEDSWVTRSGGVCLAFTGRLLDAAELSATLDPDDRPKAGENPAMLLIAAYRRHGVDFLRHLNGAFGVALYDEAAERLILGRDHLGMETLFLRQHPDGLRFATRLAPLLAQPAALDRTVLSRYLLFGYNPGKDTPYVGIEKLPPGHLQVVTPAGAHSRAYWRLSFAAPSREGEDVMVARLRDELGRAVGRRVVPGTPTGVFLSGGLDSSSVLALAHQKLSIPIHTYSYRCRAASVDESHYARLMSRSVDGIHHEIAFPPEALRAIEAIVPWMDEPFCDSAINVATWLVAQAAGHDVSRVLTGDGGDELAAGHPVYAADRIARLTDRLPRGLRQTLLAGLRRFPDTDTKLGLTVKLQRFGEGGQLQASLLSHRWRMDYSPEELETLLEPAFVEGISMDRLLEPVLAINAENDGPGPLSRSLASDYATVVGFYLRRNGLARRFGVEVSCPMLDHRLVAYAARIPERLKGRRRGLHKYVLTRAVAHDLPPEIAFRRDKLGHSIPLKQWLRHEGKVRELVLDVLSPDALRRGGVIRPNAVARLMDDHLARRRNHAHRIWALLVLELWLARQPARSPMA